MLCLVVFLRTNVINYFVTVCTEIRKNFNSDADKLLEYFEDTYIGRFFQNASFRDSLFFINPWIMFNKIKQEIPRINNSIEG